MGRKWSELAAEGVVRCCAVFSGRSDAGVWRERQCRRRAHDGGSFCKRHGWVEVSFREEEERFRRVSE